MIDLVIEQVRELLKDKNQPITGETALIGDSKILDSLGLVELCLRLEDEATDLGFEFDWTSETAMSRNRSMFKTVSALADELKMQQQAKS
jgi:acyl carrier protein